MNVNCLKCGEYAECYNKYGYCSKCAGLRIETLLASQANKVSKDTSIDIPLIINEIMRKWEKESEKRDGPIKSQIELVQEALEEHLSDAIVDDSPAPLMEKSFITEFVHSISDCWDDRYCKLDYERAESLIKELLASQVAPKGDMTLDVDSILTVVMPIVKGILPKGLDTEMNIEIVRDKLELDLKKVGYTRPKKTDRDIIMSGIPFVDNKLVIDKQGMKALLLDLLEE